MGINAEFWLANKSMIYNEVSKKKCLYINNIKTLRWYWHITGTDSDLSYTVIHWPTNSEVSYSLTALVQCSHHSVVLPYLKLPFELCSYYCVYTDNHPLTRHYPPGPTKCCTKLPLSRFPWELAVLLWRLQGFPLWFETQIQHLCLNQTVFGLYMVSKKLYLNLSKYVDKWLVVKISINIKHFSWKY